MLLDLWFHWLCKPITILVQPFFSLINKFNFSYSLNFRIILLSIIFPLQVQSPFFSFISISRCELVLLGRTENFSINTMSLYYLVDSSCGMLWIAPDFYVPLHLIILDALNHDAYALLVIWYSQSPCFCHSTNGCPTAQWDDMLVFLCRTLLHHLVTHCSKP
jgi:hypothetical protein